MGAAGASLLMQLACALFYEVLPVRRRDQYPPLFVFHVGGRFGDHSPLDVWPPRREVFLPHDPYLLLGALRDRAITRLVLPAAAGPTGSGQARPTGPGEIGWLTEAPSGWTDAASHLEQLRSAYLYSPTGAIHDADTQLSAASSDLESMVEDTLQPHRCHTEFSQRDDESLLAMGAGPSSVADLRQWLEIFGQRLDETPPRARRRALHHRTALRETSPQGDVVVQSYRKIEATDTFALMACPR
ncbi:hypothetical protein [Nesterenkonia flava]